MLTLAMKMSLGEAISVSVIGILTVMLILAVIACLIILVSKSIRALESFAEKKKATTATSPSVSVEPMPEGISSGEIELIGTDEKTAAVIMAIVSEKSGIPLSRLSFKSIRLIDEEKKGEKKE